MDLFSNEELILKPGEYRVVKTGITIELPPSTEAQVRPRSGLAAKHGITVLNTPGTIDEGYRGEVGVILINHSKADFHRTTGMKIAQMITELKNMPSKILVDAADSVAENYTQRIIECITRGNEEFRLPEIISEHKADDKYVEVGAASILAKVMRDREIEKLKEIYGEIGSGYPADELTKKFIQKASRENNFPECVRLSWNTVSKSKQTSLFEF